MRMTMPKKTEMTGTLSYYLSRALAAPDDVPDHALFSGEERHAVTRVYLIARAAALPGGVGRAVAEGGRDKRAPRGDRGDRVGHGVAEEEERLAG